MEKTSAKRWGKLGGGLTVSLVLHAVLFAAFLVHFSPAQPEPPVEESVAVELVPPPEEPAVEEPEPEAPAPEQKAEEPVKPEEAATPEPPPPPEEKPEETPPEPPAPPPAEPPPVEEPPVEEPAAEEPPPAPAPAEEEPPAGNEDEGRLRMLDPVVQFGEKDTGPRQSEEGEAATDAGTPPDAPELPEEPEAEPAAATPMPDDIALPEVELGAESSQEPGPEALSDAAKTEIIAAVPKEKPSDQPPVEAPPALTEAKTLFSRKDSDDPVAMRDMTNLSRSARADRLCLTELREQLRHASPPHDPELLPSFGLKKGTVLDIPTAAFRADGQWYNLSFRCEVDEEVTKVMTFAFDVGTPVPRSDWKSRGFPSF